VVSGAVGTYATPLTVHPVLAFLTGIISAYSSTSSVVLPAFLPMVPGIAARLPGTDALALAISINIGSAMVDVSPLSTLGALCVAAAPGRLEQAATLHPTHDLGLRHGFCSRRHMLLSRSLVPG